MKEFLTVSDIQNILNVKQAKAYEIIRKLNEEMNREGYFTVQGKVNKRKFEERYCYNKHLIG